MLINCKVSKYNTDIEMQLFVNIKYDCNLAINQGLKKRKKNN